MPAWTLLLSFHDDNELNF
ncbi:rCG55289 [Rattus norvegicus]|uniref:RCG55289 n=1 Tax=Rattus norvegicus TaxID=10116 RepID=A6J808_RAT|nr:rCG55289 [Rattus norvegicus]